MLIYMQKPDATLVAGYNKWKDQFERHVKKGEHGITIIAPTPYKKKIEEQKLDPDTKAPILDKDGKIVTEEKEIEIPMNAPSLQKNFGICTTISAIKPEIPGICPVCPVFREPGSRKKLHGLPSS